MLSFVEPLLELWIWKCNSAGVQQLATQYRANVYCKVTCFAAMSMCLDHLCLPACLGGQTIDSNRFKYGWQVLLDRLAAQELMLLQRPVISGRYSSSPFVNMLSGPLDEALRPLFKTLVHMGELVQSILSEEPESGGGQLSQLKQVIQDVEAHRYCQHSLHLDKFKLAGKEAGEVREDHAVFATLFSCIFL